MKKIILFLTFAMLTFSQAKMVNGIVCVVDGECITYAELNAVQKQMGVSRKSAMDLLIKDRIEKSAMKNITIDGKVVDKKISDIAKLNHISVIKMRKILKAQGMTWSKYRAGLIDALKKEKFFQTKISQTIPQPTDDELHMFYTNHKKEFTIPSSMNLIEYSASTKKALDNFLKNRYKNGIKSRVIKKFTKDLSPSLLDIILRTQNGHYTPPFNTGDKFISYKVIKKEGRIYMPFEKAKNVVMHKWIQQQRSKAFKDYFEKLRTSADIEYIKR